jgi:hypothetical protein
VKAKQDFVLYCDKPPFLAISGKKDNDATGISLHFENNYRLKMKIS